MYVENYEKTASMNDCSTERELNTKHNISITFGLIGARIEVGCQTLYVNEEDVVKYLTEYLSDKDKFVKAYNEGNLKELVKQIKDK